MFAANQGLQQQLARAQADVARLREAEGRVVCLGLVLLSRFGGPGGRGVYWPSFESGGRCKGSRICYRSCQGFVPDLAGARVLGEFGCVVQGYRSEHGTRRPRFVNVGMFHAN